MTPVPKFFYCAIIEEGTDEEFRQCLLRLSMAPAGPLYAHATLLVPSRSIRRVTGRTDGKAYVVDMKYE